MHLKTRMVSNISFYGLFLHLTIYLSTQPPIPDTRIQMVVLELLVLLPNRKYKFHKWPWLGPLINTKNIILINFSHIKRINYTWLWLETSPTKEKEMDISGPLNLLPNRKNKSHLCLWLWLEPLQIQRRRLRLPNTTLEKSILTPKQFID